MARNVARRDVTRTSPRWSGRLPLGERGRARGDGDERCVASARGGGALECVADGTPSHRRATVKRLDLFATPVFVHDLEGFEEANEVMRDYVAVMRERDCGLSRSNVHGWHSSSSELGTAPAFAKLRDAIVARTKASLQSIGYVGLGLVMTNMWVVVRPPGASTTLHDHPRSFTSGVYYLQAPRGSSPLVFRDPRSTRLFNEPGGQDQRHPHITQRFAVPAQEGRLVLFPAWLEHFVPVNETEIERIAVSFNFAILNAPP